MKKIQKLKKKINNYLFDHEKLRKGIDYGAAAIMAVLAALLAALAFRIFVSPVFPSDSNTAMEMKFISGGATGVSQIIVVICQLCGVDPSLGNTLQSIFYFIINIPIILLAFKGIGKRFAVFTTINTIMVSLFIQFIPALWINNIIEFFADQYLARAVFGALFVGTSSALCFKFDFSAGGIDALMYFFALRKSSNVGKYIGQANVFIVLTYILLVTFASHDLDFPGKIAFGGASLLFSIMYHVANAFIVDTINIRNKKVQLQIITAKENITHILLANIPHGATIVKGTGAFTGAPREIIYMVVSSFELKKVVNIIKTLDPNAFINVTDLRQVYGRFFIRPIK